MKRKIFKVGCKEIFYWWIMSECLCGRNFRSLTSGQNLQSWLVSSDHEEFLEDLLAGSNLLFLALLGSSFVVLSRSCFCDDQVSVALSLELSIRIIKRVSWCQNDSWHRSSPPSFSDFSSLSAVPFGKISGELYRKKFRGKWVTSINAERCGGGAFRFLISGILWRSWVVSEYIEPHHFDISL